ncbi:uncharacterized protein METZ01_LOCUS465812, partial [marine metagenome]
MDRLSFASGNACPNHPASLTTKLEVMIRGKTFEGF